MYQNALKNRAKMFSVAPMMDWTDRHCRYFHRVLTRRALLYTEMMVADAILHGEPQRLLGMDKSEDPVALQLGGSDPQKLALAATIAVDFGYNEINLNVGCPSDRVKSGTFGACLMLQPELVGRCVATIKERVSLPVTVKCRIGVDEQDENVALRHLAQSVWANGCDGLWVHARKAWLQGLSPKQNREIPPLDYDLVYTLKSENPDRFIGINGGISDLVQTAGHLRHCDGVMIGRAAYHTPEVLRHVDRAVFGETLPVAGYAEILHAMTAYSEMALKSGARLNHITRHMLGLFHGHPGARRYRQILSSESVLPGADPGVIEKAFSAVDWNEEDALQLTA